MVEKLEGQRFHEEGWNTGKKPSIFGGIGSLVEHD
jgi:hypothetical protein